MHEHGVGNKDEICVISKVGLEGAPCGVMNDAVAGKNRWNYCNYDITGVGFPQLFPATLTTS